MKEDGPSAMVVGVYYTFQNIPRFKVSPVSRSKILDSIKDCAPITFFPLTATATQPDKYHSQTPLPQDLQKRTKNRVISSPLPRTPVPLQPLTHLPLLQNSPATPFQICFPSSPSQLVTQLGLPSCTLRLRYCVWNQANRLITPNANPYRCSSHGKNRRWCSYCL